MSKCQIKFSESEDVTDDLNASYFNLVEPYINKMNNPRKYIHSFGFSINSQITEKPSGICNFSELHNPFLKLTYKDNILQGTIRVFAINYNILQVQNGKGVLFHNLSKDIKSSLVV